MVRVLLVIQVPDASDKGSVTLRFRPIDCFFLSFECAEFVIRMVFDYIIQNGRPFSPTLRAGFYVNVRHGLFSLIFLSQNLNDKKIKHWLSAVPSILASSSNLQHCFFSLLGH
jgi:hypothetical protein